MHGIALNVNVDLKPFSLINPCGFTDRKATSMSAILSQDVEMREVIDKFLFHFGDVFETDIRIEPMKVTAGGVYD